jgi:hypothetical protein
LIVLAGVGLLTIVAVATQLTDRGGGAREVGDVAPKFALASADRQQITLDELLLDRDALVLVFYRGLF